MKLRLISWFPVIIMMVIIFSFSAKPAVSSEESSMTIANGILNVYEKIANDQIPEAERTQKLSNIDHIVRKGAHFFEYSVLSCTFVFFFRVRKKKVSRLFLYSVVLTGLYASTDEFHQLFVPGRSGQIKDVLIDTSGAAAGAFLLCLIIFLSGRKRIKAGITSSK
jgi:VanZ family protein